MNVVSGGILLVLVGIVALAPRRWALLGMLLGVFFLTQGSSIDVVGLNLYPTRVLEVVLFARVLGRGELMLSRLNRLDRTLLLLYNYTALVWILRSAEVSAQQVGLAFDASLCYLAFRGLIKELDDFRWLLRAFVIPLVPYTALVFVERLTGSTAFGIVGADWILFTRDGLPRCQGSFRHASLLGSVAASFLALYIGSWMAGPRRVIAALGGSLCLALVVLSHSGGPLTSTGAVFVGWSLWRLRDRMRVVRWAALGMLAGLILFMKAPIWYLPYKISSIVGGGGYHRGVVMDRAWQDLGKWWLVGMDNKETASWLPYVLDVVGGADVTNQFLVFGIRAGLLAVLVTVFLLYLGFRSVGIALASLRSREDGGREDALILWGLGVTIFVHAVSWIGASYFDQSYVVWLLHLAAVSSLGQAAEHAAHEPAGATLTEARPKRSKRHPGAGAGGGAGVARPRGGRPVRAGTGRSTPLHVKRHIEQWQKY